MSCILRRWHYSAAVQGIDFLFSWLKLLLSILSYILFSGFHDLLSCYQSSAQHVLTVKYERPRAAEEMITFESFTWHWLMPRAVSLYLYILTVYPRIAQSNVALQNTSCLSSFKYIFSQCQWSLMCVWMWQVQQPSQPAVTPSVPGSITSPTTCPFRGESDLSFKVRPITASLQRSLNKSTTKNDWT